MWPLYHFQYTAPARPCQSFLDIKGLKCAAGLAGPIRRKMGDKRRTVSEPLSGVRP